MTDARRLYERNGFRGVDRFHENESERAGIDAFTTYMETTLG
jgi:hypothetical protein